ncbi:MAG: methylated-DNA--[protein]-cysteine S-methyltransferase [Calditrichae bacterium]|nr:methylated-DNA--[protein]-cysteine S-methyltransferase [Calditrichia bacterium]
MLSYLDIADRIGNPKAVRAVAGAVANNPISYVIPCHRVIRNMGVIHQHAGARRGRRRY